LSDPSKAIYGVIAVGGTAIGAGLDRTGSVSVKRGVDAYYGIGGSGEPTALLLGNKSYGGKFEKAYIDAVYANLLNGTVPVEVILYPKGTASGNPKITCSNCHFTGEEFKMAEDAVTAEDLSFVAKSVTFGTA